jgi:hypothetical protein
MKKLHWITLATLVLAAPAAAQTQYETAFEIGVGYGRPGIGDFDMATLLVQGEGYIFETGLGIASNVGAGDDDILSFLLRAGLRPITLGNTLVHLGGELSLHTNATADSGESSTLTSLAVLFGTSHALADHFNVAVHVFPLVFGFGGDNTITKFLTAQVGAHLLF